LLATYKAINNKYYAAKKARQAAAAAGAAPASGTSDYVMVVGDVLGGRYRVTESIGKGSFGQVVSAEDIREGPTLGRKVAVKVIKAREAFRKQAKTEIKLLEMLNSKDPEDQWCIGACRWELLRVKQPGPASSPSLPPPPPSPPLPVRFFEWFDHNGHTCLVFEHMSFNLYELLRRTHFKGVSLTLIRKFTRQVLKTLAFLRLPEVDIVHCDLKPENILFRQPQRSAVKVIDFGSSCPRTAPMYKYIQSRFYRCVGVAQSWRGAPPSSHPP
jgi:dual specificity tyrosine-phosphorylation-regulated kinase 1